MYYLTLEVSGQNRFVQIANIRSIILIILHLSNVRIAIQDDHLDFCWYPF